MDARSRTLHIGTWPEMGQFYSVYVVVRYGASTGTRPAPVKSIEFVASVDGEAVDKQQFDLDFSGIHEEEVKLYPPVSRDPEFTCDGRE